MSNFISNVALSIWPFICWYLAGLGPAFILLPQYRRRDAFLLAPLIGMCLLILIGLLQITVFLSPFSPRVNLTSLILISSLLCVWVYYKRPTVTKKVSLRQLALLGLPSLVLLLVFAWLFHHDGFHLLVGSSDPLQYCLDAKQIVEEMHTRSVNDLPIARHDHIIYDLAMRNLPYDKTYRRGGEILLGTATTITGLSYQAAFPITILNALMTLGLALGFIGHLLFRFSRLNCFILQATVLSSFYLLLLHVQGSLSLIVGITPGLVSLVLLSRVLCRPSWREKILTVIIMAGYISSYPESALVNLILPSALVVVWQWRHSWSKGIIALRNLILIYSLVIACAPIAIYAAIQVAFGNLHVVSSYLPSLAAKSIPHIIMKKAALRLALQPWNLASVVIGSNSYYDASTFNANVAKFIAHAPWMGIFAFFAVCACALKGYLKTKNPLIRLFAVPLLLWVLAIFIMAYQQDGLRFARSMHYAMPYIMLGLVVGASSSWTIPRVKTVTSLAATWTASAVLLTFVVMNAYTHVRTLNYLASRDISSDPIVLRFDVRGTEWQQLAKELKVSALHQAPVLLSGFHDTIRPLAIVSAIPLQPHVLGDSVLSFWPLYNFRNKIPWSKFSTRFSHEELEAAWRQEDQYWSEHLVSGLIQRSEQAIVPVGGSFPVEWLASKDVYAPVTRSFANIGDVIYRNEYALSLSKHMASSLKHDAAGPFRFLHASGSLMVHAPSSAALLLIVDYDGKVGDVSLQLGNQVYTGELQSRGKVRITLPMKDQDLAQLRIAVAHPVKLRSLAWG